jgi:hypothetical protein
LLAESAREIGDLRVCSRDRDELEYDDDEGDGERGDGDGEYDDCCFHYQTLTRISTTRSAVAM